MKVPIGSGVIESAIRRVVNLKLKSPGSLWQLDFAEKLICLRSQILYGRWQYLKNNWGKSLAQDFRNAQDFRKLVACAAPSNLSLLIFQIFSLKNRQQLNQETSD